MSANRSHLSVVFRDIQPTTPKPYKKQKVPAAIREAVWIKHCGRVFEHKCLTSWCPNILTVFDFQSGHNIPESKGGATCVDNLYPICARCNMSMGNHYTFDQWTAKVQPQKQTFLRFFRCFSKI